MSDEEKKALERIDYIQDFIIENRQYNADVNDMEYFSRIKNLIEKQSKEIEELPENIDEFGWLEVKDKINELVRIVNSIRKNIDKEYCCCCGVEITDENRALHNMCNECKYGIDWEEKTK